MNTTLNQPLKKRTLVKLARVSKTINKKGKKVNASVGDIRREGNGKL